MNKVKLNELIKSNNLIIPMYVIKECSKFDLTLDEFVLLIYLYNHNNMIYDPELLSNELGITVENILIGIDSLANKGLINLDVSKTSNGLLEEKINLDSFYEKISLSIMSMLTEEEVSDDNLFSLIEKEFNRKLKPMEQERIISLQKDYSDELIKEAVKEAENKDIRYIDKLLFEWKRQGVKSLDDIKNLKEVSKEPVEVYNYNWLDDDNEV